MRDPALFRRTAAVIGLIGAVVTSAVWSLLEPAFPTGYAERLAAIEEGGTPPPSRRPCSRSRSCSCWPRSWPSRT